MYLGKITDELEELYVEYYKKFGVFPDYYEETEYGQNDYDVFVSDIKKCIEENKEIPDVENIVKSDFWL